MSINKILFLNYDTITYYNCTQWMKSLSLPLLLPSEIAVLCASFSYLQFLFHRFLLGWRGFSNSNVSGAFLRIFNSCAYNKNWLTIFRIKGTCFKCIKALGIFALKSYTRTVPFRFLWDLIFKIEFFLISLL